MGRIAGKKAEADTEVSVNSIDLNKEVGAHVTCHLVRLSLQISLL